MAPKTPSASYPTVCARARDTAALIKARRRRRRRRQVPPPLRGLKALRSLSLRENDLAALPVRTCRGTWTRVTIDHFRRLALRTLYGHMLFTNILLDAPPRSAHGCGRVPVPVLAELSPSPPPQGLARRPSACEARPQPAALRPARPLAARSRVPTRSGSVARPLCTTAHPRYTRFTNIWYLFF